MFAAKLSLALAVIWTVCGLTALILMSPVRRAALPVWKFNLIGGPVFLALALRGRLVDAFDQRANPRVIDVALGSLALAIVALFAFAG